MSECGYHMPYTRLDFVSHEDIYLPLHFVFQPHSYIHTIFRGVTGKCEELQTWKEK